MRLDPFGDGITSLAAASFGMSSAVAGTLTPGERVIYPDDNSNHTPTTPVFAYNVATPRTNQFALLQTGHVYLWSSVDAFPGSVGSLVGGSDDQHPMCFQFLTGNTSTGHLSFGSALTAHFYSPTSHVQIFEATFMIPVLSTGGDQFNVRFGWADVITGAVANGAYFEVDSSVAAAGNFVTASASTRTTVSAGTSIVAGTWYRAKIVVTNNTQVDFYFTTEGTPLPATPTVSTVTNIPASVAVTFGTIFIIEKKTGTNERGVSTLWYYVATDRTAA